MLTIVYHKQGSCLQYIHVTLFTDIPSAPPSDCSFEQRTYRHSERFYHPADNCRTCVCTNGKVRCQRKPCTFTACSHPITQDCCQTCEGTAPSSPANILHLRVQGVFFSICTCIQFQHKTSSSLTFLVLSPQSPHSLLLSSTRCFFWQAAFTRGESELMGRCGMTHRTRVQRAFVSKAPSIVRKSDAHPPTVSTQSRGNAACPVMVSCPQHNSVFQQRSPGY